MFFFLSNDIFDSETEYQIRKLYLKKWFIYFYFLTVHISTNNAFEGLIFSMLVNNIHMEGTVSQIFILGIIFYFMTKNG